MSDNELFKRKIELIGFSAPTLNKIRKAAFAEGGRNTFPCLPFCVCQQPLLKQLIIHH
jgi:hypothetical protein